MGIFYKSGKATTAFNILFFVFGLLILSANFSYAQSCNPFSPGGITGGVTIPVGGNGDVCANTAVLPGRIRIDCGNVDDGGNRLNVQFEVDWNDGNVQTFQPAAGDYDGNHNYSMVVTHLFPKTGGTVKCQYTPIVRLRVGGTLCTSFAPTPPVFTRWNTENENSGILQLSETGTSLVEYLVCAGTQSTVTFTDRTTLNCVPPQLTSNNNNLARTRRFVYGVSNTITGGVTVAGTPVAAGAPLTGPIAQTATPSTAKPTPVVTSSIVVPATAQVGEIFEIRLDYWNFCNPYNAGAGTPVSTIGRIRVVAQPPAPTGSTQTVCSGTNPNNFTITGAQANSVVNWYANVSGATPKAVGTVGTLITTTTANGSGVGTLNRNTAFPGFNNTVADNYIVWASYTMNTGASNSVLCESPKVAVIRTVREALAQPGTISGTSPVCDGTNDVAFTLPAASGSTSVGGSSQYVWSSSPTTGVNVDAVNAQNTTIDFNIGGTFTSTTRTISVERQYTTAPACPSTPQTMGVTIFGQTVGGTVNANQTICALASMSVTLTGQNGSVLRWERTYDPPGPTPAGAPVAIANTTTSLTEVPPNGDGIYQYYAVVRNGTVCSTVNSVAATITVNPIPPQPSISQTGASTGLTICGDGVQQTVLQSSNVGLLAGSYQWFKDSLPVSGATSSTITLNTVAESGSYTVQVIGVAPSNCPSIPSAPVVVTINPLPTASNPTGGGAVCSGNPAPDIVWSGLTGTPGFLVTYTVTKNPGAVVTIVGPIAEPGTTFTIVSPNPTGVFGDTFDYKITALVDANNCSASAASLAALSSRQVSIGGTAPIIDTAPSITPTSDCNNGASTTNPQLSLSLTGASASTNGFILNYTVDGSANRTKTFNTNASGDIAPATPVTFADTELNNLAPSPHIIRIVSIQSPTGCLTLVGNDLQFTVNPRPAVPTGATNGIACSVPGTGVALSVNAPASGFTIAWSTAGPALASFSAVATGVVSGASNTIYTPATSATSTYYAFTRNTATGCLSTTGIAVTQTQDNKPANANAGPDQPLLCGTSATLAAVTPTNSGTGVWSVVGPVGSIVITSPTSPTSTVTGLPQDVTNGAPIQTTLRWTVSSALNACAPSQEDVILTVNPLPKAVNPAPAFCETVAGGGSVSGVSLSTFNDGVTDIVGSADRTVTYYSDVARTVNVTATPQSITNGKIYYTRVQTISTSCTNTGTIVFTINSRPVVVPQSLSYCEDIQGTNQHGPFDLTANNTAIANGSMTDRSVAWFSDSGLTTAVATPTAFMLTGSVTLYALVTNTVTLCTNVATVNLSVKPRPASNPIQGNASVCTGNTVILYQLDPSVNPGSSYTWTVAGTPAAAVQVFGGGGTNSANFFILLKFPAATGTVSLDVFETLNGCVGATNHVTINVNSAPVANTITGDAQVCANKTTVNYQVTSPNATSTYTWTVNGATIASSAGSSINVDFGTISPVKITVEETSSSGCVGGDAELNVIVNPNPTMTSGQTATVCSGATPSLVFTSTIASSYSWVVPPGGITGAISGVTVGQTGTGNLSATFTGVAALKNLSGAVGSVTFNVMPTSSASGCPGSAQSVVLTINPEPFLVNAQTKTICSAQPVNYEILTTPLNFPAGTSFTWPAPVMSDGSVQGTASPGSVPAGVGGTLHIIDVLTNTSSSPITATYTITPTSGLGCIGDAKTVVITINPEPILSSGLNNTLCSDVALGLTLATAPGSIAANNYNITAKTISAGLVSGANATVPANGVASTYLSNDSYTNITTGSLTVSYTVVPVSASGCPGLPKVITITIDPEPALSATLDAVVCSDLPAGIVFNTTGSSVGAISYNIVGKTMATGLTSGGGNAIVPASGVPNNYIAADTYTNTTNASLTVVYQVVPISSLGCPGDPPRSVILTILPEPVISSSLNKSICSNGVIALTLATNGTSVAAASYDVTTRTIDAGLVAGVSNAPVPASNVTSLHLLNDVFTNTTNSTLNVTYTVIPKSVDGCSGDPKVITVTINPEPVMSNSLDNAVCSDLPTGLTLNTNGTSISAASYNITARSISTGLTPNVSNAPAPVNGVAANYLAGDIFTNTGTLPLTVTYTVIPVSSAGCLGNARVVTLTINPEPVVSASLNNSVCSSVPIALALNNNGSSVAAASYNITAINIATGLIAGGGNATVPNNGVPANYLFNDVFSNTTGASALTVTYTVIPVSASGCLGDPRVITMTVNPEPVVSNTLNAALCSGSPIGLTLNTNGTSVGAANYNITNVSVAAGLTTTGFNATIPASGVASNYLSGDKYTNTTTTPLVVAYTVVPISASGCPGPAKVISITINPEPVVASTLNTFVCSDLVTGLTLSTDPASVSASNYNITARTIAGGLATGVGNVTVPATAVAATYLAADIFTNKTTLPLAVTYTVVPVSSLGCIGTPRVITITINPEPVLLGTLNTATCSHQPIGLTLATAGTSVAAGSYNITAINIDSDLTAAGTNAVVPSSGVAASYLANDKYSNTTSLPHNVTYTVVPVSAGGCLGDPVVITITINPEPVVSTLLNSTVCSDAIINLTLNTNGVSIAAANYNITNKTVDAGLIGAGTNVAVPATGVTVNYLLSDRYNNLGTLPLNVSYTVVPVSAGGCSGLPQIITITINPEPVLSGTLNLNQCSDLASGLVLGTEVTSVVAQNYNITLFSIAPGLTAAAGNATLPATGVNASYLGNDKFTNTGAGDLTVVYTVRPVSASGCLGDPVNVTLTIQPEPVVSSSLDRTVCSDVITSLTLDTNGTSVAAASYNITLRSIAPGLTPAAGNAAVPAIGVTTTYLLNDKFTNTSNASLLVSYTIVPVSATGCLGDPKVVVITIDPEPVIANGLDAVVCSDVASGLQLGTLGTSIGAANYNIVSRTVALGLTPAASNVAVPAFGVAANYLVGEKFMNTGNAPLIVEYSVIPVSGSNCLGDAKTIRITINPEPVISSVLDAAVCSDLIVGLTLNTNGTSITANNYNIVSRTLAPGLVANGANAVVPASSVSAGYLNGDKYTNQTAGSLTVEYVVVPVSADGCLGDPKTIIITIKPEPVVAINLNSSKCSGLATGLTLATNGTSVVAASYNITNINVSAGLVPDGANAGIANGVAANYLENDKFVNTGALSGTVSYTIVPVSADGCLGDPKIVTITIDPQPVVSSLLDKIVCSDVAISLTLNTNGTSVAAGNYNIISSVVAPGLTAGVSNALVPANSVSSAYLSGDAFTNVGNSPLTVDYTVVPVSSAGCVGAAQLITVTINPEPVLSSTLNKSVCSDQAGGIVLNTIGTSVAAANYNIGSVTVPSGLSIVSAATVPNTGVSANYLTTDSYTNLGNIPLEVLYTVVPVSADGCPGSPLVVKQIVNPEPVLGNLNKAVCSDDVLSLTLNTNGISVAASSYNVTSVSIAAGLTAAATNAVIPFSGVNATYLFNDQYTNPGTTPLLVTYTVVPVSSGNCSGDAKVITITINPEPVLSATLDRTVCSGIAGGIVLNTNGTSQPATSYNITTIVADGGLVPQAGNAIAATGVNANYLAGDKFINTSNTSLTVQYTVVPVSAGNCLGDPLIVILTIDPEPVMNPALAVKTVCSRAITGITFNTNGSSIGASTYDVVLVNPVDADLTGTATTGTGLSANAIENDSYINTTSAALKVFYRVTPRSAAGCYGAPFDVTVTINPEPVINPFLDNTVCSEDLSNIVLSTNGTSAGVFLYELVNVIVPGTITAAGSNAVAGSSAGINLIKSDKFTNNTTLPATVIYGIRGLSNAGCLGQITLIHLTINPAPLLDPSLSPTPICSGLPIDATGTGFELKSEAGSVASASFIIRSISFPGLTAGSSNTGIGAGKTKDDMDLDTYINITNAQLTATYTIAPVSAAGCIGPDQTVVITVNPAPALKANLDRTVCSDAISGIVLQDNSPTSIAATSYEILSITSTGLTANPGNAAVGITTDINHIRNDRFVNVTNDRIIVTYEIVAISVAGCRGPQTQVKVTVEPLIVSASVNTQPDICSGSAVDIELNSPTYSNGDPTNPVVTFSYSMVAAAGISGNTVGNNLLEGTHITDVLVNSTDNPITVNYKIIPRAASAANNLGCTNIAEDVFVIVKPIPKMATINNKTVCEDDPINLLLTSTTTPSTGTIKFFVTAVPSSSFVTGFTNNVLLANTTTLADALSNSNNDTEFVDYTFVPRNVDASDVTICAGLPVVVRVTVNPRPVVSASIQPPICSGDIINITLSNDVTNSVNTWTVNAPAGITGANPGAGNLIFQTLKNTTSAPLVVRYTVTPKAATCAGTPIDVDVTVNPTPDIGTIPSSMAVCFNGMLNVPLTSNVAGTIFNWTVDPFPNALGVPQTGSGSTISQLLANTGSSQEVLTYTITTVGPGATACPGATKFLTVIASPKMEAQFLNADTWLCNTQKDFLQIQLDGQAPFKLIYSINGVNQPQLINVGNFKSIQVIPALGVTTYQLISITDAFNCTYNLPGTSPNPDVVFTVGETDASFDIISPLAACSPYQAQLRYNQVAGVEYTWRFGDGTADSVYIASTNEPAKVIQHTYTNSSAVAEQNPKMTLQTLLPLPFPGCIKSVTKTVKIFPTILANVFPDKDVICSGENVQFFNRSTGVAGTGHKWFYRVQGTTAELDVRLTQNATFLFTNTTTTNPITYEVVYRGTNGNCPAPDVITPITVYRGVTAGFNEGTVPPFIGGNSIVNFTNTSTPIDVSQIRYDWDFGLDAVPATQTGAGPFSVRYTSPGPREVRITATNIASEAIGLGCSSEFKKTIDILLLPLIADFEFTPKAACFPQNIVVTRNMSTGDRYDWTLINELGQSVFISKDSLPTFFITAPGKYSIQLKTSNSFTGQVAFAPTAGKDFIIYENPMASFDVRPTLVYVPDTELTTFNFSTGAPEYLWDFGDGGTSTESEPKYTYKIEGIYDITLVAINDHGDGAVCTDTLSRKITAKQGGVTKVPNAFTPSPNGPSGGVAGNNTFNDVFLPMVKGAEEFNMQIFDRWGNLIFESNNSNIGWDGYDKNSRLMPAGVYVYKLTVRLSDGQRSTQIGDITMIR